tara:strand:- start:369 stop:581 length:213 start_codon:yes stop_codon:yes gene_type:complete
MTTKKEIDIPIQYNEMDIKRYKAIITDLVDHVSQVETFLFEDQCDINRVNLLISLGELFAISRFAAKAVK